MKPAETDKSESRRNNNNQTLHPQHHKKFLKLVINKYELVHQFIK